MRVRVRVRALLERAPAAEDLVPPVVQRGAHVLARVLALAVARRARPAQDLGLVEHLARDRVLRPVEGGALRFRARLTLTLALALAQALALALACGR